MILLICFAMDKIKISKKVIILRLFSFISTLWKKKIRKHKAELFIDGQYSIKISLKATIMWLIDFPNTLMFLCVFWCNTTYYIKKLFVYLRNDVIMRMIITISLSISLSHSLPLSLLPLSPSLSLSLFLFFLSSYTYIYIIKCTRTVASQF